MAQQNNLNNQNETDVGQFSFERAIEELESIVKRLEDGKVPLEEIGRDLRAGRGAQAPLRGPVAPGRGPRAENHARCRRQPYRHRSAGCEIKKASA